MLVIRDDDEMAVQQSNSSRINKSVNTMKGYMVWCRLQLQKLWWYL